MNETQAVLQKIASLRNAAPADASGDRVQQLERQISAGYLGNVLLDGSLRQLADPSVPAAQVILPTQLTSRARRLLEQGGSLLNQLRALGTAFHESADGDPLADHYRESVAMADTSLRMVQAFPDAPGAQLQLCAGLEAILNVVAERASQLAGLVQKRRQEQDGIDTLQATLLGLEAGHSIDVNPLLHLAEGVIAEAEEGRPLRFLETPMKDHASLARHIACHGLNVARVAARLVRHVTELRERALDVVLAALLHDVGMLLVPIEILAQNGPLTDEQRHDVEAHALVGADMVLGLFPNADWLREAVTSHHERLDGTGYPAGLRELQISPLLRLLSACDVYAALATARPHRPARDTRDALGDTLLLAEQGALDRAHAESLLTLSFYPVGSLVELADGSVGVVVATHMGRRDLDTPACPVVALLTDAQRQPLASPRHVDLSESTGHAIVRSLPSHEHRTVIGKRYPELAA